MAEYTITIKDDDEFGVVVNLSGPQGSQGPAARLAIGLATLAPRMIRGSICDCDRCRAARMALDEKPIIH